MTEGGVGGKRKAAKPRPDEDAAGPAPKKKYLCAKCGQPKAGHVCPNPDGQPTAAAGSTGPSAAAEDGAHSASWGLDVGELDLAALLDGVPEPASPFLLGQSQLVQQHQHVTEALAPLLRSPAAAEDSRVETVLADLSDGLKRKVLSLG